MDPEWLVPLRCRPQAADSETHFSICSGPAPDCWLQVCQMKMASLWLSFAQAVPLTTCMEDDVACCAMPSVGSGWHISLPALACQ